MRPVLPSPRGTQPSEPSQCASILQRRPRACRVLHDLRARLEAADRGVDIGRVETACAALQHDSVWGRVAIAKAARLAHRAIAADLIDKLLDLSQHCFGAASAASASMTHEDLFSRC